MKFESHPMIYAVPQPGGTVLLHFEKPEGWKCAQCGDSDCQWLSHQYYYCIHGTPPKMFKSNERPVGQEAARLFDTMMASAAAPEMCPECNERPVDAWVAHSALCRQCASFDPAGGGLE